MIYIDLIHMWMRSYGVAVEMKSIDEWLERLDINAKVATVLGSIRRILRHSGI